MLDKEGKESRNRERELFNQFISVASSATSNTYFQHNSAVIYQAALLTKIMTMCYY